jgi:hypothetical protein
VKILRNRWFALIASMVMGCLGTVLVYCDRFGVPTHFPVHPWLLLFVAVPFGISSGALYFLPTIIGLHKRNALAIFILNTFMGCRRLGGRPGLVGAQRR